MTASFTLIITTALSLAVVLVIAIAELAHRRRLQQERLRQRVARLERRELTAANAARDCKAQIAELRNSLTHTQRLLLNGLTHTGKTRGDSESGVISRDERKLRDLLGE